MYPFILLVYHIIGSYFYISSYSAHVYDKTSISLSFRHLSITTPPISQKSNILPTSIIPTPKPTQKVILPSPTAASPSINQTSPSYSRNTDWDPIAFSLKNFGTLPKNRTNFILCHYTRIRLS